MLRIIIESRMLRRRDKASQCSILSEYGNSDGYQVLNTSKDWSDNDVWKLTGTKDSISLEDLKKEDYSDENEVRKVFNGLEQYAITESDSHCRLYNITPIGCCRPNHKKLTADDTALVVCNNCAAIIEENTEASIEFLWQVIDQDPDFQFPDYHGEKMTVQDCWVAFEKRHVQDAVRSLLRKMNIEIVESEKNYEKTKFCTDAINMGGRKGIHIFGDNVMKQTFEYRLES